MKTTATDLARHTARILGRVERGESVQIERHDRPVAEIRPVGGVNRPRVIQMLRANPFTAEEKAELQAAIKEGHKVFHGHGD